MDPTAFTPLPGPEPAIGELHAANALVGAIANAHYARSRQFEDAIHALQAQSQSIPYNPTAEQIAALPEGGYYVTGP